jgi:hypothetical protein
LYFCKATFGKKLNFLWSKNHPKQA